MSRNTHRPEMHRRTPVKVSVRVATTAAGTLATSFENGDTVDGVVLATGDRILIKDQASGAENGIRDVKASGAPSRSYDMDTASEVMGALVYVREGTVNGGKLFRNTNTSEPTLDATALTFASAGPTSTGAVEVVIDGGGSAITTGVKVDLEVPFACTLTAWRVFADQSGSIVIDVWKDTYANYPPTVADTITAAAKPTLSAAAKNQDTTLTGWTTAVSAGDILRFNVDSAATVTRVTLSLSFTRTL